MRPMLSVYRSFVRHARMAVACLGLAVASGTVAVSGDPDPGQQLFEKSFMSITSREFNAKSCADCHRMGGIGGAGQQQFNARSIGIEELRMPAGTSESQLSLFLASLYPKFVGSDRTVSTVASLPHFGGGHQYKLLRSKLLQQLDGRRDEAGGPATHADLQAELRSEIRYASGRLAITAKSFQRNTPALFGAGLIDAITDDQILYQAKLQRRKNVSGRPATLSSGGIGRFGWRGNVATLEEFTRQACVNELGLRVAPDPPEQPPSPTRRLIPVRQQRVLTEDISQRSLVSLTAFIESLPAPRPIRPTDVELLKAVDRGEQIFGQIGCAICHVPDVGPAKQIYSDLLLHDMGETLRGASIADPYIYDYDEIVSQPTVVAIRTGYYGATVPLIPDTPSKRSSTPGNRFAGQSRSSMRLFRRPYQRHPEPIQLVPLRSEEFVVGGVAGGRLPRVQQRVVRQVTLRQVTVRRNRVRPTNVSQEWRTAPLWGLRDSAPYMHDGRAATVDDAIKLHEGESRWSLRRYQSLEQEDRQAVLVFLNTLAAPTDAPRPASSSSLVAR